MVLNHASLIKNDIQGYMEYGQGVYTLSARYGFTINMFEE